MIVRTTFNTGAIQPGIHAQKKASEKLSFSLA